MVKWYIVCIMEGIYEEKVKFLSFGFGRYGLIEEVLWKSILLVFIIEVYY